MELTYAQRTALRPWFYEHAYIPDVCSPTAEPDEDKTREFKDHIAGGCTLVWKRDPDFSEVLGYKPVVVNGRRVPDTKTGQFNYGLRAAISCACGRYDRQFGHGEAWFIPEQRGILDILRGKTLDRAVANALADAEEQR